MPPVAQFTLGQKPAEQKPNTMPPVAQFTLPPQPVQAPKPPMSTGDKIKSLFTGFTKGVGDDVVSAARTGETIANQTAGRVVNKVLGNGFTPMTPQQQGDRPTVAGSPSAAKTDALLKSDNNYEKAGKVAEFGASMLIPGKAGTDLVESNRLANVGRDALRIAGEKATQKTGEALLRFGSVGKKVVNGAKAIEHLVRDRALKVGDDAKTAASNADVLRKEIGTAADSLITRIKNSAASKLVKAKDLRGMLKEAITETSDSSFSRPGLTQQHYDKFLSFLPKGQIYVHDILQARKDYDAWVAADRGERALDPATHNALSNSVQAIRHAANNLVERMSPEQHVKDSLKYQTALYKVLQNVSKKGAKAINDAEHLANMPGWAGRMARNPVKTKIAEGAGILAAGQVANSLGFHPVKGLIDLIR